MGVIVNENSASLTIRNQGGDTELKKDDIATRDNTRRSLMPEGFDGLGATGLRDVIAYMVSTARPTAPDPPRVVCSPPARGHRLESATREEEGRPVPTPARRKAAGTMPALAGDADTWNPARPASSCRRRQLSQVRGVLWRHGYGHSEGRRLQR